MVNEAVSTVLLGRAVDRCSARSATCRTQQSLGGEDFGWYLDTVPGAMARLGTRTPGGPTYDLHQGDLRVDERADGRSAREVLAAVAVGSPRSPTADNARSQLADIAANGPRSASS